MSEAKKGILSKIFGGKKSGCCDLKVEEVPAEPQQSATAEQPAAKPAAKPPCCCGEQPNQASR